MTPHSEPTTPKPTSPPPAECPLCAVPDTSLLLREPLPRTRHISATLHPRILRPILCDVDFVDGGDEREALHTFTVSWHHEEKSGDEMDRAFEFVYEGSGGLTWPLRRVRVCVDGVGGEWIEHEEREEEEEDDWEEVEVFGEGSGGIEGACESTMAVENDAIFVPAASVPREQEPARLRIRIPKAEIGATPGRFKVRVRAAEQLGSESVRGLPRRGQASAQAKDKGEGDKEENAPKKFRVRMRRRSLNEGEFCTSP
jgi:hypothetical protein